MDPCYCVVRGDSEGLHQLVTAMKEVSFLVKFFFGMVKIFSCGVTFVTVHNRVPIAFTDSGKRFSPSVTEHI